MLEMVEVDEVAETSKITGDFFDFDAREHPVGGAHMQLGGRY